MLTIDTRFKRASPLFATLMAAITLLGPLHARATPLDIAQVPLFLGGTAAPNVMFLLDDSSSMSWGYLPDDIRSFRTQRAATAANFNPALQSGLADLAELVLR